MPWLFEAKKALTVEVRAPLPTHRDRPPVCPENLLQPSIGRLTPLSLRRSPLIVMVQPTRF
jgi:hypothetical protein